MPLFLSPSPFSKPRSRSVRTLAKLSLSSLGLISLGLAACSTTAPSLPGASSGAPMPTEGYDWYLNQDASETSLTYGMAETDDVPLDLSCKPGSRSLTLLLNTEKGARPHIALESGGETETYRAKAEASPLGDSLDLTAQAKASDPVFKRFEQTGWLAVHTNEVRRTLVATEAAKPQISQFFEICDPTP